MPLSDYSHWNEEAPYIWWEEEGKHVESDAEDWREDFYSAADAFAEELGEFSDEELFEARLWDNNTAAMIKCIEWEIRYRGLEG